MESISSYVPKEVEEVVKVLADWVHKGSNNPPGIYERFVTSWLSWLHNTFRDERRCKTHRDGIFPYFASGSAVPLDAVSLCKCR